MRRSAVLGRQAFVVGGGVAGLATARVLSDYFERVAVFERDTLDDTGGARAGVPQGKHLHALLAAGQRVLDDLFQGFSADLERAGAARLVVGLDLRVERPGFDPFPQRDLGFHALGLTRPLLEGWIRRRVRALKNVRMEPLCRALSVLMTNDGAVRGVEYRCAGRTEAQSADFVVDASGTGDLTLAVLREMGKPLPPETTIGVDIGYSSAVFDIPSDASSEWKGVMHLPLAPTTSRSGLMMPVEGNRWMLALGGRRDEHPPGDEAGLREYAQTLRTKTIADAIRSARLVAGVDRFRFSKSRLRHFSRLQFFPSGLLPIGDAICRVNPTFGQGVSVALLEVEELARCLATIANGDGALSQAWRPFFTRVADVVNGPWALAAVADFVFPRTIGERPTDFAASLRFSAALTRAMARYPDIHRLAGEVQHLLRPRSVLMQPPVVERILAEMTSRG